MSYISEVLTEDIKKAMPGLLNNNFINIESVDRGTDYLMFDVLSYDNDKIKCDNLNIVFYDFYIMMTKNGQPVEIEIYDELFKNYLCFMISKYGKDFAYDCYFFNKKVLHLPKKQLLQIKILLNRYLTIQLCEKI